MNKRSTYWGWLAGLTLMVFISGNSDNLFAQSKPNRVKQTTAEAGRGTIFQVPYSAGNRAAGDNCDTPIVVNIPAGLPFTDLGNTTCGRGNTYDNSNLGSYDNGEDIIYRLNITSTTEVTITMDPKSTQYTGLGLFTSCPIAELPEGEYWKVTSGGTEPLVIVQTLNPGTYYVMVDCWPPPGCFEFDLTITTNDIPPVGVDPVGLVVATELSADAVKIDWSSAAGISNDTIAEWLYYDDGVNFTGIGGPPSFFWAIKFDPDQLADYDGTSLTKISIYNRTVEGNVLRICVGPQGQTLVYEQALFDLPIEAWSEVTLDTPLAIDVTKELWITIYTTAGMDFPAGCGLTQNEPNGDLISNDGLNWQHLPDIDFPYTWNLRGFVTDMQTNRSMQLVSTKNKSVYEISTLNIPFAASGVINTSATANIRQNNSSRALQGFNVYRTSCATGELQFLGFTADSLYTDYSWGAAEPGAYKWGVVSVYDEANAEIVFSNCLDKDMFTQVSVKVITNSGDSPRRTHITFTNTSEPELNLVYDVRVDLTGYLLLETFRKGTYHILVEKDGFAPIMETVEIDSPTNLSYTLEELVAAVTDLHVSATGLATWRSGGADIFENIYFDFEKNAQGWGIQNNVTGWQWGNSAALSSPSVNFSGNSTKFIAVNAELEGFGGEPISAMAVSPMMSLVNADQVYLSFDYLRKRDALSVHYSINGGDPVLIERLPLNPDNWTNHLILLPEGSMVENVQIIFQFTEADSFGFGAGIDNIILSEDDPADALNYYKVWLDGIFVTNTSNARYQYDLAPLTPGQEYYTEVAAFYSNGMSAKMDYTWTYFHCDSFPGPTNLAFNIVNVNNVVLNWEGGAPPPPPDSNFVEGFEAGILPAGWVVYDVDGDTYQWENTATNYSTFDAHSGMYCMASASYINGVGGLTPNNWLVTPSLLVTDESQLKFWVVGQDPTIYFAEKYYVKISTTGNSVSDFTTTLYTSVTSQNWQEVVVDLSAYADQAIYIAFQHTDVTEMFFIKLDDVTVTNATVSRNAVQTMAAGKEDSTTFEPGAFMGTNVYRNGQLIAEMMQENTFTDTKVEPGYYDYCVTFIYEGNAMSCISNCLTDVLVTENCHVPWELTAIANEANEITLEWNPDIMHEFRYDDGTVVAELGFTDGIITSVLGAKHTTSTKLTELSWFTTKEGGPHNTIQVYVFGLTSAGMPDGNNILYTAAVSNTDDTWNTHNLPNPLNAEDGFYIAIGFEGFVGLGIDDGVDEPYKFQLNTHYFSGDYTENQWSSFESIGFNANAMIRAIGVVGAKASYAIAPEMTPVDDKTQIPVYKAIDPVVSGSPRWSVPVSEMNRAFLGYNIYKNGSLLKALWPETNYTYKEGGQGGQACYTVTAAYDFCGVTNPSNEACVNLVGVKSNDLSQIKVYPNPAHNIVNIDLNGKVSQVVIYNFLGQVVYENNVTNETELHIDVRSYDAGAYLVKFITNQGQSLTRKVVVSK